MYKQKRKTNKALIIAIILSIGLIAGYFYIKNSIEFEEESPTIKVAHKNMWNKKTPIEIDISDNKGLKYYKITLSDGKNEYLIAQKQFNEQIKETSVSFSDLQDSTLDNKAENLKLKILVKDTSKSNMFEGNTIEKIIDINIDTKRPTINIVSNSYMITQGGTALVIFQALDENLEKVFIQDNENTFKVQPYKKEGYYASLMAWPFNKDLFDPTIIAVDKAGNKRQVSINMLQKHHNYKDSWIKARDSFIDGKITDLIEQEQKYSTITDKLEKLKAINEDMRLKNEELIHSITSKVSGEMLKEWKVNNFYPLKNGQKVASHGDHRHYYYNDKNKEVSQSYHLGYDLASTKMATIKSSNKGRVVYSAENGIYGNMPIIDHGFGLYTLYGHCSQILVNEGDIIKDNQPIAKTGVSGLALGDHLHFGILVQGIEVRPVEWFDADWIRKSVDDVFEKADKIIASK